MSYRPSSIHRTHSIRERLSKRHMPLDSLSCLLSPASRVSSIITPLPLLLAHITQSHHTYRRYTTAKSSIYIKLSARRPPLCFSFALSSSKSRLTPLVSKQQQLMTKFQLTNWTTIIFHNLINSFWQGRGEVLLNIHSTRSIPVFQSNGDEWR